MTTIDREQQLKQLDDFIESSKHKLNSILSRLGWSIESISNNVKNIVVCPFDKSHHVPEQSLDQHLKNCQWKAEGYGKHDLPLSVPSLPVGAPSSIKFDEQLQEEVIRIAKQENPAMTTGMNGRLIPRTSDRLTAEFTREEKCAMYEYAIANTVEPDIGDDIADMNKPKSSSNAKNSSYLELLAQERNLKRRRAKYRGVHTNKKSQIEILREVVSQQMEMLAEYISEKRDDEGTNVRTRFSPDKDFSRNLEGNAEKHRCLSSGKDFVVSDERSSIDKNVRRDDFSKKIDIPIVQGRSKEDRRYGHRNHESRDSHSRNERERSDARNLRDSCEKRSHKSSHERHRNKSKDRRKRKRSRDKPDNSRSSRDLEYDERKWESAGRSRRDDRKSKKRRSRSR